MDLRNRRLRVVYSEKEYTYMYACAVKTRTAGVAKAVELKLKGLDVWHLEVEVSAHVWRTVEVFDKPQVEE